MYESEFKWIKDQKDLIDETIKTALARFYQKHHQEENFEFDIQECYKEALNLSNGEDLCYDRPNVALPYALWYLGRRINTMIGVLFPIVMEESTGKKEEIHLFDIGAGTGATQIAMAIIHSCLSKFGRHTPRIVIENIDTSPFMLDFCRSFLWIELCKKYNSAIKIECNYSVNSWVSENEKEVSNPWFTASYLFDSSDNTTALIEEFNKLIERFEPVRICLTSSNQPGKKRIIDTVKTRLIKSRKYIENQSYPFPFEGIMKHTNKAKKFIKDTHNAGFNTTTTWQENSFYSVSITKQQSSMYSSSSFKKKSARIDLFNPPIVIRRDIKLNEQQKSASELNNRPTIITGPAGCGKSVVLSERIKNVVENERAPYNPNLSILVTTFNKDLISYLSSWVQDILKKNKLEISNNSIIRFKGSTQPNIRFMHFDILPTRIGEIRGNLAFKEHHLKLLEQIIVKYKRDNSVNDSNDDILNPEYLYDEYNRIFYGQKCQTKNEYLDATRIRRRPILQSNSPRRNHIAQLIILYLNELEEKGIESIYTRRRKLLNQLFKGDNLGIFSHIFVDEFQDCTIADYSIFYGLLSNNNNLVLTGDFAQSIQLGGQASVPREDEEFKNFGVKMRNRQTFTLTGSYRLPARVSECLVNLSEYIQSNLHDEADLIAPYKGSPPGSRPIIVYGETDDEIARKLLKIQEKYSHFNTIDLNDTPPKRMTILEKDYPLSTSLNSKLAGIAETETILKLKGMEKLFIVLSTNATIENTNERYHFIYTILTRTASLLVITLSPKSMPFYAEPLRLLRRDRLIFWDRNSKVNFENFTK